MVPNSHTYWGSPGISGHLCSQDTFGGPPGLHYAGFTICMSILLPILPYATVFLYFVSVPLGIIVIPTSCLHFFVFY